MHSATLLEALAAELGPADATSGLDEAFPD
jgi:hypothetical protein